MAVSIIIPARNEAFLPQTVADVLAKARGEIELLVVLDGYWPDPPLPDDPRLVLLHKGEAQGMRPAINGAVRVARHPWLMKLDAHCMVAEGFDLELVGSCDQDWIMVPRRYALDPEAWAIDTSNSKYPVDYHYLSYPFERPDDPTCGLHGTAWSARKLARADIEIDDEMSSQGSCWFMSRGHWDRLGEMEADKYGNFINEAQEIGLKTWLGGGRMVVNKRTWYAHLYKGSRYGRGYSMGATNHRAGAAFAVDYWMHDRWPERKHNLRWLVEKFGPVPTWPADLDQAFPSAPRVAVSVPAPAPPTDTLAAIRALWPVPTDLAADGPTEIPNVGRDQLAHLFRELGFTRGVEIGVERGLYSQVLCEANPGLQLTCVDPWRRYGAYRDHVSQAKLDGFFADAQARLAPYGATFIRDFSVPAAAQIPDGSLDFVYIDGNHSLEHVIADIAAWSPKVRSGGIIAGHDWIRRNRDITHHVVQATMVYTQCHHIAPWFVLGRKAVRPGEVRDKNRSWLWVRP